MKEGSRQKDLSRIRPPRVQITYDVETGGAIEKKELPLVVGIMADLAGKQEGPVKPIKQRKFGEIDRDNFDAVMKSIKPRLDLQVDDELAEWVAAAKTEADDKSGKSPERKKTKVVLEFEKMADFRPEEIVLKHEALAKLFQARQRLNDLIAKLDGNDELLALFQQVAKDGSAQQAIKDKLQGGKTNA